MYKNLIQLLLVFCFISCEKTIPPSPLSPLPTERQLKWHEMEYYAFVHFNMNTFSNMEWGLGGCDAPQDIAEADCPTLRRIKLGTGKIK
jgi:hypothetical protein